ncbi:uncharacterized protein PHALS_08995 [Plasmopara halstedii]|uniref:Uncharacterized protein n=1 Tax=Plasmopara halstedii TaxID=4781 RepID=A0A0P1ADI6_PLAHL|nr:uncharacterized protein PHALS_08995 [Plasmopara halstedii]CEG38951.1 hypothetical protein PHALS_08995 [Plasmopara halstedii]|eukprot:XP_024575320.1 hypothetical protein PHALS_08995 [Plasmopara halstedii]
MEVFFAGFNAEELAMMQELLRLLLEDDDVHQPTPGQEGQTLLNELAGGMTVNDFGDYQWGLSAPNGIAWNAPPAMMAISPQYPTQTSRIRTNSHFGNDDEPMLKRGRMEVAPTMRASVNCKSFPQGSGAGHFYY